MSTIQFKSDNPFFLKGLAKCYLTLWDRILKVSSIVCAIVGGGRPKGPSEQECDDEVNEISELRRRSC